ncbi:hypothetical protein FO519_006705 [Halicephalobus sp. NKZ332]|nr:hypothetical protein FO519_006705 [Halicephalobus sp. NKZ332]
MLFSTHIVILSQEVLILNMKDCINIESCYDNPDALLVTHLELEFIKFIAEIAYLTSASCVLIERACATITMTKYENTGISFFVVIDICHWTMYCMYLCVIFFVVFPAIGYYFTVWINIRRYKKSTTVGTSYTLSERYMLSQNIKTAKLLHYLVLAGMICNFYACVVSFKLQ